MHPNFFLHIKFSKHFSCTKGQKKPINKKKPKQNVHGLSRDCLGIFLPNLWEICLCASFSTRKKATHKQFRSHPFPGQSRIVIYVYRFFVASDVRRPVALHELIPRRNFPCSVILYRIHSFLQGLKYRIKQFPARVFPVIYRECSNEP